MSKGISLRELVYELEDKGFELRVTKDQRYIEIREPKSTGDELLVSVGVINPSDIEVKEEVKNLEENTVRDLLPPIFNYVLSFLANTELEISGIKSGKSMNNIVKDIKTEDSNYIRQGMIDTLIQSDRMMLMADVYGDVVCRRIDLLSGIKEMGYQESTINDGELNVIYKGNHVMTASLNKEHEVRREIDWADFPYERRDSLIRLLKWYVDTPNKFRSISFSLLEQVLISNLPKQYKWAYRDEDDKLWALDSFDVNNAAEKEIICDPTLFRMITKRNPFPTHLGRLE